MWKADTARSYMEEFKNEVTPLLGKPWAKLIDLTNWRTSYPEVNAIIGKHMAWSLQNGCVLSIYVLNNPSTFRQLNQMFSKGGIKEVALTFRTMAEAENISRKTGPADKGLVRPNSRCLLTPSVIPPTFLIDSTSKTPRLWRGRASTFDTASVRQRRGSRRAGVLASHGLTTVQDLLGTIPGTIWIGPASSPSAI